MELYPRAKLCGITWERFWSMTMREFRYEENAHGKEIEERDYFLWLQGRYIFDAMSIVMFNSFKEKGVKARDYMEKPYIEMQKAQELTEYEKERQRKEFLAGLEVMMMNFNAERKEKAQKAEV